MIIEKVVKPYENLHPTMGGMEEQMNIWLRELSFKYFTWFTVAYKQTLVDIDELKQ